MTTIKITDKRAIIVHGNSTALAEWKTTKTKIKGTDEYVEKSGWYEYLWPSTMENAVNKLAQEFVSDLNLVLTMQEFKEQYQGFVEQLKEAINGEGN